MHYDELNKTPPGYMTKVMEYNFNLFIDDSIFENIFMV
jgi:hypothetical protein